MEGGSKTERIGEITLNVCDILLSVSATYTEANHEAYRKYYLKKSKINSFVKCSFQFEQIKGTGSFFDILQEHLVIVSSPTQPSMSLLAKTPKVEAVGSNEGQKDQQDGDHSNFFKKDESPDIKTDIQDYLLENYPENEAILKEEWNKDLFNQYFYIIKDKHAYTQSKSLVKDLFQQYQQEIGFKFNHLDSKQQ